MSIWNDLKLLWNHHISNWKVSHINFFPFMEYGRKTTWRWLLTWDIFSPFTLIICRILLGVAPAKTTRTWISSWVTYFCIYFFFCRTLFNHLSPAEFLSYKHANLRHHKRSTIFQKNMYNIQFFPWPFSIQTTTKRKKAYCISHRDVQQLQQSDRGAQASTANAGTPICCTALLQFSENSSFTADEKWRSS